ncbi:MAG: hypothetical protein KAG96_02135 [Ichthyobacteriaceae bacterium]|nr:hypothetical protein [Ichthyobacteriaceae bacterium]
MKTIYIDMDNVIVDFESAIPKIAERTVNKYKDNIDDIYGVFALMDAMPRAIESVEFLSNHFNIYIMSASPWENPSAWSDKLMWVRNKLPKVGYKKLILTHNKQLNKGDYLIDDRLNNGADKFEGELIHFGQGKYSNWLNVIEYLCDKENINYPDFYNDGLNDDNNIEDDKPMCLFPYLD